MGYLSATASTTCCSSMNWGCVPRQTSSWASAFTRGRILFRTFLHRWFVLAIGHCGRGSTTRRAFPSLPRWPFGHQRRGGLWGLWGVMSGIRCHGMNRTNLRCIVCNLIPIHRLQHSPHILATNVSSNSVQNSTRKYTENRHEYGRGSVGYRYLIINN